MQSVRKCRIKRGDVVFVRRGEDAGKTGKVLQVIPETGRVLVEGVNLVKRHMRKSQDLPKGGIVEKEAPMALAKVCLHDANRAAPAKA